MSFRQRIKYFETKWNCLNCISAALLVTPERRGHGIDLVTCFVAKRFNIFYFDLLTSRLVKPARATRRIRLEAFARPLWYNNNREIVNDIFNTHFCGGTLVRFTKLLRTLRRLANICANGVTMRSSPWL